MQNVPEITGHVTQGAVRTSVTEWLVLLAVVCVLFFCFSAYRE